MAKSIPAAALLYALATLGAGPPAEAPTAKPKQERRFTDARIAAAEAKRQRKAARRAARAKGAKS